MVGLVLAVVGGTLIDKLGMEQYVVKFKISGKSVNIEAPELTRKDRMLYAKEQTRETVKRVWVYIVVGVGIGALIHNWIPEEWIQLVLGQKKPAFRVDRDGHRRSDVCRYLWNNPRRGSIVFKGVGVGTILAFMMAVTALSLPSIIMLKKVLKTRLLVTFVGIVSAGIIFIGYAFNALGFLFI